MASGSQSLPAPIFGSVAAQIERTIHELRSIVRLQPFDTSSELGRSRERYRRVALSAITALGAKCASLAVLLVSVPLTIRYLGQERYGLWMAIVALVTTMGFADLGIGNGLAMFVSEADGKSDRQSAQRYVSSAFFLLLAIAGLLMIAFALAYRLMPWPEFFNVHSPLARAEAGPAAICVLVSMVVSLPLATVIRVQFGYQEVFKTNLWSIAGSALTLVGILVAIRYKAGLPWLAGMVAGAPVLGTFMNWLIHFRRCRPWLFPSLKTFDWYCARKVLTSGILFFFHQLFALIAFASDNLVISHISGANAVAAYSIAQRLFSIGLFSQFFVFPLWPAFCEAVARRDYTWAKRTLNRAIALTLSITAGTACLLMLVGQPLIKRWVNASVVPSLSLLLGFAMWIVIMGHVDTMNAFLNQGSTLRTHVLLFGAASVVAFALKIVFARNGYVSGVVWATVISMGVLYAAPALRLAYRSVREC